MIYPCVLALPTPGPVEPGQEVLCQRYGFTRIHQAWDGIRWPIVEMRPKKPGHDRGAVWITEPLWRAILFHTPAELRDRGAPIGYWWLRELRHGIHHGRIPGHGDLLPRIASLHGQLSRWKHRLRRVKTSFGRFARGAILQLAKEVAIAEDHPAVNRVRAKARDLLTYIQEKPIAHEVAPVTSSVDTGTDAT